MAQMLTQSLGYNLSKNPETEGFDLKAGQTWLYPTNYPVREYQYNIVQKALLNNTLVSLPTGLGKTFIAAVVMYNFFRWYPMGKVVFMAPTRPLVKQQIDACYNIMAIPKETTAELTGTKLAISRKDIWKEKRVFFITPQILQNDLDTIDDLGPKIKCIVFDEAHRARGNHAYCEVIRKIVEQNKFFRVLALSATPGSTINDVLEVVQNLLISHLEFRTEESLDVQPYVYKRNLTTVVVPLGDKLQSFKDKYLQVLEYYTKTLMKYNIIQGNCGNLTKGKIFLTMKEFQRNRTSSSPNYAEIMKSLNICVTLYHAYELLTRHGLRSFSSFFSEHIDKPLLRGNTRLIQIVNDIKEYLGPEPNVEPLPDGSHQEIPKSVKFGHPKFYKLREILVTHFKDADDSSRVIVFFEYRNSAMEAYALLIQEPVLKPRIFLGQGQGVTQRLQLNVVKSFREGQCNVLLSTCIGEEGLDVGNVDLIVCFDISNKSPIRMVQRMGRTGRKKEGHITVLVTEGKEQQILKDCLIHKNNIAYHVLSSKELAKGLTYCSPRLVPDEMAPKCEKIHITVRQPVAKKNSTLKDLFRNASSSSSEPNFSPDLEIIEIEDRIPSSEMLWNKEQPLAHSKKATKQSNIFTKHIEKQRSLQPINQVNHSKSSTYLVELLQIVDSKRFNLPITQIGRESQLSQNRNLRQGDIRNMFFKLQPTSDTNSALPLSQSSKSSSQSSSVEGGSSWIDSRELFTEISNYLSIEIQTGPKRCRHCPDSFDCADNNFEVTKIDLSWIQLDDSTFETVTLQDMKMFTKSLDPDSMDIDLSDFANSKFDDVFDDIQVTQLEQIAQRVSKSGNVAISLDQIEEDILERNEDINIDSKNKSCVYEAPKNLNLIMSRYGASIIEVEELEKKSESQQMKSQQSLPCGVSPIGAKNIDKENDSQNSLPTGELIKDNKEEILRFFYLDSLDDIFICESVSGSSQETIIYSPDIIDSTLLDKNADTVDEHDEELQMSPILRGCSWIKRRKNNYSRALKSPNRNRPNLQNLRVCQATATNQNVDTPSKFTMNATKISSTPFVSRTIENDIKLQEPTVINVTDSSDVQSDRLIGTPKKNQNKLDIDVDDICDLSAFGISPIKVKAAPVQCTEKILQSHSTNSSIRNDFDIDDFCDLTSFGISNQNKSDIPKEQEGAALNRTPTKSNVSEPVRKTQSQSQISITKAISNRKKSEDIPKEDFCDFTSFGISNRKKSEDIPKEQEALELHRTPTKSNASESVHKTQSQSQMPITQLLSYINKDNCSGTNPTPQPGKASKESDKKIDAEAKIEPVPKKSRLSLNKTIKPDSPVQRTQPKKNVKQLLTTICSSRQDSDDEFEEKSRSPVFKRPKLMTPQHTQKHKKPISKADPVKANKKKKPKSVFINDEVEVSDDEFVYISEDEEDEDHSMYEASFVTDETQDMNSQMHARYLQSLRSPSKRNNFTVRRPTLNFDNIFSQEVVQDDTYLEDSFVVHDEIDTTLETLTELEILESKLRNKSKRIRKEVSEDDGEQKPAKKRRRIMVISDDSD